MYSMYVYKHNIFTYGCTKCMYVAAATKIIFFTPTIGFHCGG